MDVAMKHCYGRLTLDDIRAARERAITSGNLIKEEATYAAATTNKTAERSNDPRTMGNGTGESWPQ